MTPDDERAYRERLERMVAAALTGTCAHLDNGSMRAPNIAREAVAVAVAALHAIDEHVTGKAYHDAWEDEPA